jgi:hypothetical protein
MTVIRDMTPADLDAVSLLAEQLVLLHHSWDTTRLVVLYSASSNADGQALFNRLGYRPTMVELTLDL